MNLYKCTQINICKNIKAFLYAFFYSKITFVIVHVLNIYMNLYRLLKNKKFRKMKRNLFLL